MGVNNEEDDHRSYHSLVSDDRIDTGVKARTQHEKSENEDDDINNSHYRHLPACEELVFVDVVIGYGPEDESEERIKGGGHDTKKVSHTWDHAMETLATHVALPKMLSVTHFPSTNATDQMKTSIATQAPQPTTL